MQQSRLVMRDWLGSSVASSVYYLWPLCFLMITRHRWDVRTTRFVAVFMLSTLFSENRQDLQMKNRKCGKSSTHNHLHLGVISKKSHQIAMSHLLSELNEALPQQNSAIPGCSRLAKGAWGPVQFGSIKQTLDHCLLDDKRIWPPGMSPGLWVLR